MNARSWYRTYTISDSIREPMNDFFRFQNKALISATPIVPEKDSRFDGFMRVLIQPDYVYRQKLKLITTNNVLETLQEVIEAKRGTVCIFCNSIRFDRQLLPVDTRTKQCLHIL